MKNVISVNFKIVCLVFFLQYLFYDFSRNIRTELKLFMYLTMSVHWLLIQILDPRCNMHIFYEC